MILTLDEIIHPNSHEGTSITLQHRKHNKTLFYCL